MNKLMLFFSVLISLSISADLKNDLEKQISPLMDKVIEWRHDIHQNPELSNREFRTAKKVEEHLLSLGIQVETKVAYTGVYATFVSTCIPNERRCSSTFIGYTS